MESTGCLYSGAQVSAFHYPLRNVLIIAWRWLPVFRIASLNVRDDSEIDWKLLSDDDWNLWSAHSLQRRWLTLKRGIRGHEEMTHQGVVYCSSFYSSLILLFRNHGYSSAEEDQHATASGAAKEATSN